MLKVFHCYDWHVVIALELKFCKDDCIRYWYFYQLMNYKEQEKIITICRSAKEKNGVIMRRKAGEVIRSLGFIVAEEVWGKRYENKIVRTWRSFEDSSKTRRKFKIRDRAKDGRLDLSFYRTEY